MLFLVFVETFPEPLVISVDEDMSEIKFDDETFKYDDIYDIHTIYINDDIQYKSDDIYTYDDLFAAMEAQTWGTQK